MFIFLLILKPSAKIYPLESYDKIVSAEISNKLENPHLYRMVLQHMIHGPCGRLNPKNICMTTKGNCRNHYPKSFYSMISLGQNSYANYKRRDNGDTISIRKVILDNRWVVPYNSYLLAKFDCHLNVKICSTIKAIKYLYKYIYKGHDRVAFNVTLQDDTSTINEIDNFQCARWVSPPKAAWRIYRFYLNEMHPVVYSLQFYLENKQLVSFKNFDKLSNIAKYDLYSKSMLTEYFRMNKTNEIARTLLYKDFPQFFVWIQQYRLWVTRKKGNVIGKVISAYPTEGERYYLRLLLNHIKGPTSFLDLKTVHGVVW
ncbi:uncharacterized protein LOC115715135 [Cannabis sativa]|uniref:uncharacterized protein LOC115715135 n=1 Tax=Cannabis sativa TaxID=3483 RepID=UPI0029CA0E66|nr:uncharacterized protein LOC115715135 [Cannabis sativa]XP_060970242.1 uncharacterized protein LOC115715135 [Cannabis sativa]XP_060970243.1 uncharacterized protein LOC115715135 [Cannabis sativa]